LLKSRGRRPNLSRGAFKPTAAATRQRLGPSAGDAVDCFVAAWLGVPCASLTTRGPQAGSKPREVHPATGTTACAAFLRAPAWLNRDANASRLAEKLQRKNPHCRRHGTSRQEQDHFPPPIACSSTPSSRHLCQWVSIPFCLRYVRPRAQPLEAGRTPWLCLRSSTA